MRHALPAQASQGCCPGRAARATSPQNSERHRLVTGNSVGCRPSRAFARAGAPRRVPGISADKPSKDTLHRRPIRETGQKPTALQSSAEALRRKQDSRRQIAASMSHACGRTCPKGPEKRSWEGRPRRRKCTERNCGTREAPQKRRRECMDWLHYVEHFYEGRESRFADASRGPCRRRAARTTTP